MSIDIDGFPVEAVIIKAPVDIVIVNIEPSTMCLIVNGKRTREVEYNETDCLIRDLLDELGIPGTVEELASTDDVDDKDIEEEDCL